MERADRNRRAEMGTQAKGCATLILLACCPYASALNPSLDINQYAHNAWTIRAGFFKGIITSIAQTPDGYLLLGTEFGLLRFDGVRTTSWQPQAGEHLPSSFIRSLLAARDGRLWIGTDKGLASWNDGKLTHYTELAGQAVQSLLEDRQGTVWAGGGAPTGKLCAIQSASVQCRGEDGSFGSGVLSLYEDRSGNLWAGAVTGLWRWKPGPPKFYPTPDPTPEIYAAIEGDRAALWIAMRGGIRRFVGGKAEAYPLPGAGRQFTPVRLLRDRNGGLWIGTANRGLLHVREGRTDVFAQSDGLSGDVIENLFEDREGNIWVATLEGLDRFRDFAVPTISFKQGLSKARVGAVLAAGDGSVWLGTSDGLNRWNNGQVTIYRQRSSGLPDDAVESLLQDGHGRIWVSTRRGIAYFENGRFIPLSAVPGGFVHSIAEDSAGNLWINDQAQGLFHLIGGSVVERIPWPRLGRKDAATTLLPDPVQGGLWLGFFQGGLSYFKNGQVRALYGGAEGLGEGGVSGLHLDRDGRLWAATAGGLSRVKDGRVATLTSRNGLPCDTVHWVIEDDDHSLWLGMACGLLRISRTELDAWVTDSRRVIQAPVFDSSDGVTSHGFSNGYNPSVAKSVDGRMWFVTGDGVSFIDPRHLPFNKTPPPVHVEQITVDRKLRWQNLSGAAASNLHLPALSRDLVIDYTALSFVAPEKVRFRVKLEGHDPDWKDAGNERKAFYNDLPPRHYRFRVMASNNSGVWNETGDSLDFSIDPAYYQTTWFRASCVAAFFALLWALYRYRLYQIKQEFNARLEERVGERTRIAGELHDTLLQSFQGSLLFMHAARNLLSRRPEQAGETLDKAIHMAAGAIGEGRDAIQDLRSRPAVPSDLAQLLTATGQDLAQSEDANGNPVIFRVAVEGEGQALDPIIQDEAYRIARELLRNAFRHARASQIEAEIRYEDRLLRVLIRDDGKGIEREVVEAGGRAGHWGLQGMRERAKRIGAQLEFWSEAGAGTEVELSIPASIAYAAPRGGRFQLLRKKKANP
ncbi:MAG TPA: two-component regulator propeller domain-containing protein [Candidatus Acidoferrales bacterium]|nr:two-component regulator propeller domain-containing protein [Candidatus Acidoferrales bacterium]